MRSWSTWLRRRHRSSGQGLVEFALVITIFLVLIMALFDFGRAVYATSSLGNAARMGGRTAIVNQNAAAIRQRAADQAVALGLDPTAVACSPTPGTATSAPTPTSASGVCIEYRTADLTAICSAPDLGCVAVITAKWTYTPITPIAGQIFGQIVLTSTTRMPVESVCSSGGCPVP